MFKKKQKPAQLGRQRLEQPATRGAVFSYHASRSARAGNTGRDLDEPEQPAKRARRKRWWHKLSNIFLIVLVAGLLGASLQLGNQPKIVIVGDDTAGRIFLQNKTVYAQAAHRLFAASPANSNKITVETGHIAAELRRMFPELAGVSISLPVVGHQPVVYVQPAMPRLILQGQDGEAFVVDRTGRALINVNRVGRLDELAVPTVKDQSGLKLRSGQTVLDSTTVLFISEITGQLQAKNIPVSSLTLPQGSSEVMVGVEGKPYVIKCNIKGDAREEAGAFLAVQQHLEAQHIQPSQYIDVRVSGRAYYK